MKISDAFKYAHARNISRLHKQKKVEKDNVDNVGIRIDLIVK